MPASHAGDWGSNPHISTVYQKPWIIFLTLHFLNQFYLYIFQNYYREFPGALFFPIQYSCELHFLFGER